MAAGSITTHSDIDVINTVLIRLGQSPIAQFGQNAGSGLIMQSSYNVSRDALLRKQPWSFAKKWVPINLLSVAPVNLDILPDPTGPGFTQFTGAYQLPNDCLRVFRFSPKQATWRIVGRQIYTDAIPPTIIGVPLGLQPLGSDGPDNQPRMGSIGAPISVGIEYIRQEVDPNQWDALFYETFIWKLMMELSFGITGLLQSYGMASKEYEKCLVDAAVVNGLETWPDPYWSTELTDPRYGYVGVTIQGY
jgi:hypothetical protein